LIVAPIGRTKDVTRFETPTFFSTACIVTGRVAAEELVEKAIRSGSRIFAKWILGEILPRTMRRRGRVTKR
jgi:hypothetical protein